MKRTTHCQFCKYDGTCPLQDEDKAQDCIEPQYWGINPMRTEEA